MIWIMWHKGYIFLSGLFFHTLGDDPVCHLIYFECIIHIFSPFLDGDVGSEGREEGTVWLHAHQLSPLNLIIHLFLFVYSWIYWFSLILCVCASITFHGCYCTPPPMFLSVPLHLSWVNRLLMIEGNLIFIFPYFPFFLFHHCLGCEPWFDRSFWCLYRPSLVYLLSYQRFCFEIPFWTFCCA